MFYPTGKLQFVDQLFQDAMVESLDPIKRPKVMPSMNGWQQGDDLLSVATSSIYSSPKQVPLTWDMWTSVLTGINQFRLAYPGLDFSFKPFIENDLCRRVCDGELYWPWVA